MQENKPDTTVETKTEIPEIIKETVSPIDTVKETAIVARAQSFVHAGRGLKLFFKTTPNALIHLAIFVSALMFGFVFHITYIEWVLIVLAAALVFVAEAFNTAIEIDIDLTSPEFHPYARDTKDVAAGAVLLASIFAAVVGLIVFGHHLSLYFGIKSIAALF